MRKIKFEFPLLFFLSIGLAVTLLALLSWRIKYACPLPQSIIGVAMELMGMVTMAIFIGGCYRERQYQPQTNRSLRVLLFCIVLACFSDGCGWMMDGLNEPFYAGCNMFFNSLYSLMNAVCIYYFSLFLTRFIQHTPNWIGTFLTALRIYLAVLTAALVLNVRFGFFHTVTDGVYVRGPWFAVQFVAGCSFLVIILADLIQKEMDLEEKWGILGFILIPLILMVLQLLIYGFSYLAIASCFAATVVYVHAHNRRARLLLQQSAEQEQQQTALMLSQIRPHFLYNSLSSIVALCDSDPQLAKQTTINFSNYLERNLEDLTEREPIPMEKELDHVDAYLQIEQVRFGDLLRVEYEIETTDFTIPSLVLQPLVENAVKHGLHPKPEGGTVTIAAAAVPGGWEVSVTDDGVGFDTESVAVKGHGIGIRSIRQRLDHQVGGTLTISSKPGVGTRAVLFIPKEDKKC